MITRYRKESRASTIGLAAVITVLALLTFPGTRSGLAVEATPGLNADAQRSFTKESRLTFVEQTGHYLVVAKISEPGNAIRTLQGQFDRLKDFAVTQFDNDAPGLRAACLSGFESGYTAAFMGAPPGASRTRGAPTHDRPSFARQVGFLAGERAAFEVLLEAPGP